MRLLRGATTVLLLALNLTFWGSLIVVLALIKLFLLHRTPRRRIVLAVAALAERWVGINDRIFDLLLPTVWDIEGIDGSIRHDGHYLIISNHLSWVDVLALLRAFHGHTALLRFFLKHELLWFPIVGQACWALEFPFMRRYSSDYLQRHPEKRGRDLETTRRACRRFRRIPVAILNFVEGTRFTREKQADEDSPYRHLLRPRIGGIAFVLASLGDQLDSMVDVTLAYRGGEVSLWRFISGQVPRILIRARRIDIPVQFLSAAITEPGAARDAFKLWIESIWGEKDALLDRLEHGTLVPW
jgi:1-acyl-sn-glycerol-3-phosphate acyltransferase